ncbi:MAG: hypothetical protein EYC68_21440 [Chloroflexota bacterium]|nr:MAG: hypothetical protein EYC68_21440 [Chloroflexota bacterium]
MNFLLVLLFVPLLFFLPGYLISRTLFRNPNAFSPGERWFLPIAISVCVTTWLALTLAEFGVFSLLNVSALVLVLCALVTLFARKKFAAWTLLDFKPDWLFLAIVVLALFLFAHPAEYVTGGTDAGTYINIGANIARTGGIAIHDAQVAQLPLDSAKTFYWQLINPFMLYKFVRLPGFFIADPAQGLVLPQFLHLYPAWLALWNSMVGVQWGLYATPFIALLGSVAFYFLARNLFGKNFARLALFLLVITVPQFWFARYPVAEAMTQFLMLTGMWALLTLTRREDASAANKNGVGLGVLAGVAFGQVFFTRADAVLLLVPLFLYALILIFARAWRREHWALFGAFGIVLTQAVVHMFVFAPNYLYFQYSHALRMQNIDKLLRIQLPAAETLFSRGEYLLFFVGAAGLGIVALFFIDRVIQRMRARWGKGAAARFTRSEKYLRIGGAILIGVLFVAFYFILPRPESWYAYVGGLTSARSEANLIKLGWYLSPIGIGLAALGGMLVALRDLNARNAFFFGTATLFALLYLDELYSNPHYIYTTRHYIPLVIPLFVILAARALQWLWNDLFASNRSRQRAARIAAASAFALWMLYNVYAMGIVDASRTQGLALRVPFVSETVPFGMMRVEPFEKSIVGMNELGGTYAQVSGLAQQLDPNAVIIFSAGRDEPSAIATPLKYIFGRDAFVTVFNNPPGNKIAALIDAWRAQGRDVILAYGTNGGKLQIPNYALEPVGEFSFDAPQWAFAYDFMPRSAWQINLNYALYRAVPRTMPDTYPFVLNFGGQDFPYLVNGFLERSPEARSRWIGAIADSPKTRELKWIGGSVQLPPIDDAAILELTVRARAPRENVRLQIKSGENILGNARLSPNFAEYTFQAPVKNLKANANGYRVDFISQTTLQDGRVLGAELESLQATRKE